MADSVKADSDSHIRRRRWPYVAFGLVVLAALYLLIFQLPEPRLTLDYLKALTWPGLVAVVLYWLREPLREKVAQLLQIGAFGVDAQFANNQRLQQDVMGPAAAVLADTEHSKPEGQRAESDVATVTDEAHVEDHLTVTDQSEGATDGADPESTSSGPGLGTVQQAFAQLTAIERAVKRAQEKQAIEDIMRVSAWWGYDMAKLGFRTRPTPVVEWTEDGRPLIQYAKGEPGRSVNIPMERGGATPDLKVMASRLEQEIRDLEAKVESPMTIRDYANMGTGDLDAMNAGSRARLRKLKSQLRTIDPDSPLGIE